MPVMKTPRQFFVLVFAWLLPSVIYAAGLSPWQFGMTREQVASFKQFGPYKSFPGGDLETYNREYHGRKEDVQFYFVNNKLVKIGIYLGEQLDQHKALPVVKRAAAILEKDYGKLESPEITVPPTGGKFDADVFAAIAITNATLQGKTHFRGVKQPKDMEVWATIMSVPSIAKNNLAVTIFFQPK
jgi:hypothetical protein